MEFLFFCFKIACLLAMLWSNVFSQSLYDDDNRNNRINRDSKLVVFQSLLHNTETILKEKVNNLQETKRRENLMTEYFNEIFSIYMFKKVPNGKLYTCLNPNITNNGCQYLLFCNVEICKVLNVYM